jgi:hypothetical protein
MTDEADAFEEVVGQQSIGVLIRGMLLGRMRVAEVDGRTERGGGGEATGHLGALVCQWPS